MFTGIITAIGSVERVVHSAASMTLEVACSYASLEPGESIAVNGVCLTVVEARGGVFLTNLSAETLGCSTLDALRAGTNVNLERALSVGDRFGGHIVSGHVDGVGRVSSIEPVDEAQRWRFEASPEVHRFVAVKGSIAIDGVSLTVNAIEASTFEVMLVPFTLSHTTLGRLRPGDPVNLEADVLARYVVRALDQLPLESYSSAPARAASGRVTLDLLDRAGFLDRSR